MTGYPGTVMTITDTEQHDFTARTEPLQLFAEWLEEARTSEPNDPTAMSVATVDPDGMPNVRMTLLKGFDESGFVFYTNFESQKGTEILATRKAALGFHWKSLRRQVRIRGRPVTCAAEQMRRSPTPIWCAVRYRRARFWADRCR